MTMVMMVMMMTNHGHSDDAIDADQNTEDLDASTNATCWPCYR